jgi:hypothetical protein
MEMQHLPPNILKNRDERQRKICSFSALDDLFFDQNGSQQVDGPAEQWLDQ